MMTCAPCFDCDCGSCIPSPDPSCTGSGSSGSGSTSTSGSSGSTSGSSGSTSGSSGSTGGGSGGGGSGSGASGGYCGPTGQCHVGWCSTLWTSAARAAPPLKDLPGTLATCYNQVGICNVGGDCDGMSCDPGPITCNPSGPGKSGPSDDPNTYGCMEECCKSGIGNLPDGHACCAKGGGSSSSGATTFTLYNTKTHACCPDGELYAGDSCCGVTQPTTYDVDGNEIPGSGWKGEGYFKAAQNCCTGYKTDFSGYRYQLYHNPETCCMNGYVLDTVDPTVDTCCYQTLFAGGPYPNTNTTTIPKTGPLICYCQPCVFSSNCWSGCRIYNQNDPNTTLWP